MEFFFGAGAASAAIVLCAGLWFVFRRFLYPIRRVRVAYGQGNPVIYLSAWVFRDANAKYALEKAEGTLRAATEEGRSLDGSASSLRSISRTLDSREREWKFRQDERMEKLTVTMSKVTNTLKGVTTRLDELEDNMALRFKNLDGRLKHAEEVVEKAPHFDEEQTEDEREVIESIRNSM